MRGFSMHGIFLTGFCNYNADSPSPKRTAGAHRCATYLRERNWDIEVLEFVMAWSLEQLKTFFQSRVCKQTVFVGFSGTFPIWSQPLEDFFSWLKINYPHIVIIAGGQIANNYKIQADWYIDGFGERALEALLKHIVGNAQVKWQFGINGRKVIKANLDYPSFPMGDLRIKYEDRDFIEPGETLATELGRGCVFNCSFCNFPVLGVKTDHSRDADNFYNELAENYDRFGVTKYILADETVNDYSEKLEKFARVTRNLPFQPRLYGFARADLLVSRTHDWDTMIGMGFVGHHYGLESTNHKTLKVIGKGMNPDILLPKLVEARKYFKKHSQYKSELSFIAGLPYETPESLQRTIEWVCDNWVGESPIMFPLYIPSLNDNQSRLAIDYKKYGYRESTTDSMAEVAKFYSKIPTMYGVGEALIEHKGISWENDTWNLLDVMKIVVTYYMTKFAKISGISMWQFGEWEHMLKMSYDELAERTYSSLHEENKLFQTRSRQFIDNYIDKKLNWVPRDQKSTL